MQRDIDIDWQYIQRLVHEYTEAKHAMEAIGENLRRVFGDFILAHETIAEQEHAARWLAMQPFKLLGFTVPQELLRSYQAAQGDEPCYVEGFKHARADHIHPSAQEPMSAVE